MYCREMKSPIRNYVENKTLLNKKHLNKSENDIRNLMPRSWDRNINIARNFWVEGRKTALLGRKISFGNTKTSVIPVVAAAPAKEGPPEKPKKMKLEELPLDKSPHADYNSYQNDKMYCPETKRRVLFETLLPYVKTVRTEGQKTVVSTADGVKNTFEEIYRVLDKNWKEVLAICRSDKHLLYRQGAVATAGVLGFLLTSRKRFLLIRKSLGGAIAATLVGAICMPKETDETIRNVAYHTAQQLVFVVNKFSPSGKLSLGRRLPCAGSIPQEPKPTPDVCGQEKAKREAEEAKRRKA